MSKYNSEFVNDNVIPLMVMTVIFWVLYAVGLIPIAIPIIGNALQLSLLGYTLFHLIKLKYGNK